MRTQVAIIGAGPAGLLLSHLLDRAGIDSVVLEIRSREYVQNRVRAGVLEHGTVELLAQTGLGGRLSREGIVHHGIELQFNGERHRIPMTELTRRSIWIYGQQKVVEDLIDARLAAGGKVHFEVDDVAVHGLDTLNPRVTYAAGGMTHELEADFIAGCDGFHGICRPSIPDGVLTTYEREFPFAWLGILAKVAPSNDELIYSCHERGFALLSLRSPTISRLYLQVGPHERVDDWPDDRIWAELQTRLAYPDWTLSEGPILEKSITGMRSFVVEPMQYGRMFLAGDAAHIVPPTGAKGLNLAVNDVRLLADAFTAWYAHGDKDQLAGYSEACLRRVWRAQHFSSWMTGLLHTTAGADRYERRLQLSLFQATTRAPWLLATDRNGSTTHAASTLLPESAAGMSGNPSSTTGSPTAKVTLQVTANATTSYITLAPAQHLGPGLPMGPQPVHVPDLV